MGHHGPPWATMGPSRFVKSLCPVHVSVTQAIACVEKQAKLGQLRVPPEDPVARKFVLLVDFQGVGLGSLVPLTVRDLMVVMQDHLVLYHE